jgi:succinate dehydrogenase / fumarate reductase flavoprotein subunit
MSTLSGLFACGECAAGLHGANRLGGNSLSDLLVFGKRAGQYAAEFARGNGSAAVNNDEVEESARRALAPFERGATGEGPYQVQESLQTTMQNYVGIVRVQDEMERALAELEVLKQRADRVGVPGNREYNPGWHTALDLRHLLIISATTFPTRILRSGRSTTS